MTVFGLGPDARRHVHGLVSVAGFDVPGRRWRMTVVAGQEDATLHEAAGGASPVPCLRRSGIWGAMAVRCAACPAAAWPGVLVSLPALESGANRTAEGPELIRGCKKGPELIRRRGVAAIGNRSYVASIVRWRRVEVLPRTDRAGRLRN
jgi:hypothetical protein